jgi:hypothetical protein
VNRGLKWKLILGFLLVFVAGGMTGAFFGASHARHLFFGPHHREMMSNRMLHRLRVQLHLTDEQAAKISPIVDKTVAQLEEIRTNTGRRVHETIEEAHREMAANLTEEQRGKLRDIEERHRRWRHRAQALSEPASRPETSPPE